MSKFNPRAFALALVATTLTVGGTAALAQDFRSGEQRASSAALARVISVTANMDRISEQSQHCTEQQQPELQLCVRVRVMGRLQQRHC